MKNKNRITNLYRTGESLYKKTRQSLDDAASLFPVEYIINKKGRVHIKVTQKEKDAATVKAKPLFDACREDIEILETTWLKCMMRAVKDENLELYNQIVAEIVTGRGDGAERWLPEEYYELDDRLSEIEYKLVILKEMLSRFYHKKKIRNPYNKYDKNQVVFKLALEDSHILKVNGNTIRRLNLGCMSTTYIENAVKASGKFVEASKSISSTISKYKLPKNVRKALFDTTRKGYLKIYTIVTIGDLTEHKIPYDEIMKDFDVFISSKN